MNLPELFNLFYIIVESMDRYFEFWLTGSFAVVIAAYFTSARMTRTMFLLLSVGYVLFSTGLAVRFFLETTTMLGIREQMILNGAIYDESLANVGGLFILLTFAFGTVGTIIFLWQCYKGTGDT